jgi:hypothetical protein
MVTGDWGLGASFGGQGRQGRILYRRGAGAVGVARPKDVPASALRSAVAISTRLYFAPNFQGASFIRPPRRCSEALRHKARGACASVATCGRVHNFPNS